MTRLPVDTWLVTPRLDLPPYELNTVCPVTGETGGLEDHHIFRRSFTALGKDNEQLYWVEVNGHGVRKNRVALSPTAHERLTTNRARLEYSNEGVLFYVEGTEAKPLFLHLHLLSATEKVGKPRRKPKASTPEERKARVSYCVRTPKDEEMVLPELEDALREHLRPHFESWSEKVPSYYVWVTAAARVLQS